MKFFRREQTRPEPTARNPEASQSSDENFYAQHPGEEPLNESASGPGRQTRRTSLHSPARRRETSNRASDRQILLLLFRVVSIFILIVGGYFLLRVVLDRLNEPSEKDKERWEKNSELMEKAGSIPLIRQGAFLVPSAEVVMDQSLILDRLERWEVSGRNIRSAEANSLSGIDEVAIDRLGQALAKSPENQKALKMLLMLYMRNMRYAEAIPVSIQLLDQNDEQWDVKLALLESLQNTGLFEAAIALSEKMLSDQPSDLTVLELAAASYRALSRDREALALYERILEYRPEHWEALSGCGQIHELLGEWALAIPYYQDLLKLDPNIETYYALARCYAQQGEGEKSVAYMGQAASLFGEAAVSQWLRMPDFDPVRESVSFRSFTDRIVGIEQRKAIEEIRRREIEKAEPHIPSDGLKPQQPALNLKPGS